MRVLMMSDCYPRLCNEHRAGRCDFKGIEACPVRYAYWWEAECLNYDSPHYTGYSEEEARKLAETNPRVAETVAEADRRGSTCL